MPNLAHLEKRALQALKLIGTNPDDSRQILNEVIQVLDKSIEDNAKKSPIFKILSSGYRSLLIIPDFSPFITFANTTISIENSPAIINDSLEMLYDLYCLADDTGKIPQALEILEIFEKILLMHSQYKSWWPDLYRFFSKSWIHLGQESRGYEYLIKASYAAEELKDYNALASINASLSNYHIGRNQLEKAKEYGERSMSYYRANQGIVAYGETVSNMYGTLNSLGIIYAKIGMKDEAIKIFAEVISFGGSKWGSLAHINMVELWPNEADFLIALNHLEKAEALAEEINYFLGKYSAKFEMAKLFHAQKHLPEARKILIDLFATVRDLIYPELEGEILELLYQVYKSENDFENALKAYEEYFSLQNKAYEAKSKKQIEELEIRFQVSQKEAESKLFQSRTEHLQKELKANESLLINQATQLIHQTELLAKFRDEMREIVRQTSSQDPTIKAIKEKLKELPCKQIDWEKFETEFKAVHPEFAKKLYEKFPDLTPTENKMCTLLRLNLKSHEIARLFCLSERSVETHRFNIRKKVGISREENLGGFLNAL